MGSRRYRGPITTLEQAVHANLPVRIECGRCNHRLQMHAYTLVKLIGTKADAYKLPLWRPIDNLLTCKICRMRVAVTIHAPVRAVY